MFLFDWFINYCSKLSFGQLIVTLIIFAIVSLTLLFYLVYQFDKHCMQPQREKLNPYLKIERERKEKERAERARARKENR